MPNLLFAAICELATGKPIACADSADHTGKVARSSAVGAEALRAAAKIGKKLASGVATHRRLAACTVGELRIFSLCYGRHIHIVATPAGSPGAGSAFAAAALLADLSARWDLSAAGGSSKATTDYAHSPGRATAALDDVGVLSRLAHFASTSVEGDKWFSDADLLATTGAMLGGGGDGSGGGAGVDAGSDVSAADETRAQLASSRQAAAELRQARQMEVVNLSAKVAELETAKREMELHSQELLAELAHSREQQLEQLRMHAKSMSTNHDRHKSQQQQASADHTHTTEAWSSKVHSLQGELGLARTELAAATNAHDEARSRWHKQSEEAQVTIASLSLEVEQAQEETAKERRRGDSLKELLTRSRTPVTPSNPEMRALKEANEEAERDLKEARAKIKQQESARQAQVRARTSGGTSGC